MTKFTPIQLLKDEGISVNEKNRAEDRIRKANALKNFYNSMKLDGKPLVPELKDEEECRNFLRNPTGYFHKVLRAEYSPIPSRPLRVPEIASQYGIPLNQIEPKFSDPAHYSEEWSFENGQFRLSDEQREALENLHVFETRSQQENDLIEEQRKLAEDITAQLIKLKRPPNDYSVVARILGFNAVQRKEKWQIETDTDRLIQQVIELRQQPKKRR